MSTDLQHMAERLTEAGVPVTTRTLALEHADAREDWERDYIAQWDAEVEGVVDHFDRSGGAR